MSHITCPHCGGDITKYAESATQQARSAKAKNKARTTEQARKAARARWDRARAKERME